MTERMSFIEFVEMCGGVLQGYGLREGQTLPRTYGELVSFMYDRLDINEDSTSVEGLARWLSHSSAVPGSCSPAVDTEHATAVVLIGGLPDPDGFVGSLPEGPGVSLFLPPPQVIREMLITQA